jgi:hypothetical protein
MEVRCQVHTPAVYLRGRISRSPLNTSQSGAQNPYTRGREQKKSLPCRNSNPGRPARSLVTILTELFRLLLVSPTSHFNLDLLIVEIVRKSGTHGATGESGQLSQHGTDWDLGGAVQKNGNREKKGSTAHNTFITQQLHCICTWLFGSCLGSRLRAICFLGKKLPASYGTCRFITVFTKARHRTPIQSQVNPSTPSQTTSLRSILISEPW